MTTVPLEITRVTRQVNISLKNFSSGASCIGYISLYDTQTLGGVEIIGKT